MQIETYLLAEHGWVPNNAKLPVILYRQAMTPASREEAAAAFEDRFQQHGWPAQWRDGVYDYHHYHSTAHEVLGVAAGSATLMIGGPDGREIEVTAGDALLKAAPLAQLHHQVHEALLVGGGGVAQQGHDVRVAAGPARGGCAEPLPALDLVLDELRTRRSPAPKHKKVPYLGTCRRSPTRRLRVGLNG